MLLLLKYLRGTLAQAVLWAWRLLQILSHVFMGYWSQIQTDRDTQEFLLLLPTSCSWTSLHPGQP